jgi:DNA recombination protein RmuC
MAQLREDRAGQHGQLLERVAEAHRVTESLRVTTEGLQRALANPQARGQWGERMADDVLRAAGFVEGVNYVKQRTLADGTRPDVTFLLPDDRMQHMDVKFPLAGYLRWCEATSETERATALAAFLRDVRARVKELARPGYADERTAGFVLLFIPNESVYGFIHGHDAALADEALAQRVVLCSPFTLFAVLGVIRQAADAVALQRGADEVLDVLAGFTKQWDQFTERLDALGRNLQTAQNTYEQVNGPRRRQLERQLDRVEAVRQGRGLPGGDDPGVLREVSSW